MKPNPKLQTKLCPNCGMDTAIRNPSGHCDHLYYPDNLQTKPEKWDDWHNEFNEKFGKVCLVDNDGNGAFMGSYLIEFIEKLLSHQKRD